MQKKRKLSLTRAAGFAMVTIGIVSVGLSAFYASSYLAILGASFLFWSGILFYIAPSKYIPVAFLTASTTTNMSNIERLLSQLNFPQKGIYLPPKNLQDPESSLVFLSKTPKQDLPTAQETTLNHLLSDNQDSLLLTPPGFGLSKIFEEKLGMSFTKTDLTHIQKSLPKILTENLEIIQNMDIQTQNNFITIELAGNIFQDDCQETQKYPHAHNALGCLLSSSIACALAKATGKPVTIENEEISNDGKTTKFEYRLLE
jgi:hypothetical protein